jgi:hypothetical protein
MIRTRLIGIGLQVKNKKSHYEKVHEARAAKVVQLRARFKELCDKAKYSDADLNAIAHELERIKEAIRQIEDRNRMECEIPVAQRVLRWYPHKNYSESRGIGIIQPGRRRKRSLY